MHTDSPSLRVLMIVFNVVGRGTYYRAVGFARGLVVRGHQVTLLTMSPTSPWRVKTKFEDGVEIVAFPDWLWGPLRSGWDPIETLARINWLRGRTFDIVHAFEARPTIIFPSLFATRWREATLVMDWCDWFGAGGSVEERPNPLVRTVLRPVETWFEEHFRTWAKATTVINQVLYKKAVALGVNPDTILELPNGADTKRLRPIERDQARQQLGLPLDKPMIGYVGSAFLADLRLMGQAFERLHTLYPEVQLLRLGQHTYPIAPHLKEEGALIEPGWLSDEELNLYMAACDIFWLPLVNSGANQGRWPAKLTDYLSVGRPILATRVGSIETLFEKEALGRLANDNPEDVAHQTLALLQEEAATHQRYSDTARRLIREKFDWHKLAGQLEALYYQAIKSQMEKATHP